MISTPVSIAVVVSDAALAAVLVAGVAHAARAERRRTVLWLGGGAVAAWFALAFVLAHQGTYDQTSATTLPPAIVPAVAIPTALGCALLALAPARRAIDRVPLHWLVGVQLYRVVGGLFLIAWLQGDMPAEFALPAGIGDVLVGLAAPLVAVSLARHGMERTWPRVMSWCVLGIFDLVVAITCGLLTAPSAFQQLALDNPNAAITSYPFVLIPTFAVPAAIILHVYVLGRVMRQPQPASSPSSVVTPS